MSKKSRSLETKKLINEKTPQLYIYETISCSSKNELKEFFTEKAFNILNENNGNNNVKVIIPEYPVYYTNSSGNKEEHKIDFKIFYKNNKSHNVEVEWKTSNFYHHGEQVYKNFYKGDKGFIIALEDDEKLNYIEHDNIKIINPKTFSLWFTRTAKEIVNNSISNHLTNYKPDTRKYWLIPLGEKAEKNYVKEVLNSKNRVKKWAFPFSHFKKAMRNALSIKSGDIVIFIYGCNGHKGKQYIPNSNWFFTRIDIVKVINGYYCDIYDNTYEDDEWEKSNIEEKKYMHYFDFILSKHFRDAELISSVDDDKKYPPKTYIIDKNFELWKLFCKKCAWSSSQLGYPARIDNEIYNFLYNMIIQYDSFED